MLRPRLVLMVIGAACALSAAARVTPAAAATVAVNDGVLVLHADPSEPGRYGSYCCAIGGGLVVFADRWPLGPPPPFPQGAPATLTPGPGCTARAPLTGTAEAECVGAQTARFELGGGLAGNSAGAPPLPSTVFGSPGQDTITGGAPLTAYGFEGNDNLIGRLPGSVIDGGPGDDNLNAFTGTTVIGGPGNDVMSSSKGQRDIRYDCGPGQDILQVDRRAGQVQLDASCPPILIWPEGIPVARLAADGTARVPVAFSEAARGTIQLYRQRRSFGSSARIRSRVTRATVRIRLGRADARRVRSRGRNGLVVSVFAFLVDASGERAQGGEDSFGIRLRARR